MSGATVIDFETEKKKREKREWPVLYGKASTGKIKLWKIWVEKNRDGSATILTEHGYEEGEQQLATVTVRTGKNLGKKNETTPFEQACSEAESKWNKKIDKKYAVSKRSLAAQKSILPMLAHEYQKRFKSIEWPAFVQPKLDGVRCLAIRRKNTIVYRSRGGKDYTTLSHLTPYLMNVMEVGETLDGEIFTRDLGSLQAIASAVKKQQDVTALLEFWIYDIVRDEPYEQRLQHLRSLQMEEPLVLVNTFDVKDEEGMLKLHAQFMRDDYEGTIIRNKIGVYKPGPSRSPNLQKYKDHEDKEFIIVGGKEGVGKDEGAVTFLCLQEDGEEFDCRPRGTYEQRQAWWKDLHNLIGKELTVRFNGRSEDNIPMFPRGIVIRDYE